MLTPEMRAAIVGALREAKKWRDHNRCRSATWAALPYAERLKTEAQEEADLAAMVAAVQSER